MNPYAMVALVILGITATVQYFLGTRTNRALAAKITGGLEDLLKPGHTNYVNIGGAIGYNFVYALSGTWTSAKGTLTLSPRHSLLYFPISRLLGFRDRFYLNFFTKKRIRGEAHLVSKRYLRKSKIDGIAEMSRRDTEIGGRPFVLLWRGTDLSKELEAVLAAVPDPTRLRHFCSFPGNKTFYLHTIPLKAEVREDVEAVLKVLPRFLDTAKES